MKGQKKSSEILIPYSLRKELFADKFLQLILHIPKFRSSSTLFYMTDNAFLIHQYSDRHTTHMKGLEEKQVIGYLVKRKGRLS